MKNLSALSGVRSWVFAVGVVLAGCSSAAIGAKVVPDEGGVEAGAEAGVEAATGLIVEATVASANLGDEGCGGPTGARSAGACIALPPDAAMGTGPCGGPCRPSTVQIQFTAGSGTAAAHVEIVTVQLLDSAGRKLELLSPSAPQAWDATAGAYRAWDQTVAPSSQVKSSYALSSPSWSTFDQSLVAATYRLEVTLQIDGNTLVIESPPLNREPILTT